MQLSVVETKLCFGSQKGWCKLVVTLAKCCGAKMKRSPYIEVRGGRSVVMRLEWAGRNTDGRYRITRTSYPSHARSLFAD